MPPKYLTLIRHGQAYHNSTGDHNLLDPVLTPLGVKQCQKLNNSFLLPHDKTGASINDGPPASSSNTLPPPTLLVSSPLTRTLQTTLISFHDLLKAYPTMKIITLAELQETANLPCDTGRSIDVLKQEFTGKGHLGPVELGLCQDQSESAIVILTNEKGAAEGVVNRIAWENLDPEFPSKDGRWAGEQKLLKERARLARKWLYSREEEHVVAVLHGGFLHYLTEDWTGHDDGPGTGWYNTEYRTYQFAGTGLNLDGWEMYSIREMEESKSRRRKDGFGEKPLGKTERMEYKETVEGGEKGGESKN
ncbi:MAG: hypothetical protein L6R37_005070 [Teloschistes peruensis]|nr:MAG: hypothetical protein L6R37_005070 [Teloschistes peruensis]